MRNRRQTHPPGWASLLAVLLAIGLAGCATTTAADGGEGAVEAVDLSGGTPAEELRLGFFGNVTHAPALIGVERGYIAEALGETTLTIQVFNAGPAAVEALFAGAIDASFIGPNPAINAFAKSNGDAIRIVGGSASGGAQLIVQPGINSAADLKGKELATPQLGNTQDVALRAWLADEGLVTSPNGGGDVTITPQENAQTLQLFKEGGLDGAWLPEPWASRLVLEGGGKVLVDERQLWPEGQFVTTHLIVSTEFLADHPQTVRALLEGELAALDWIAENDAEAKGAVNEAIAKYAGKPLSATTLDRAWSNVTPTADPIAASLQQSADDSTAVGLTDPVNLKGIYDLRILNELLTARGRESVSSAGLGEE